nr:hypothetical protein [Bacteroidota bacterium]
MRPHDPFDKDLTVNNPNGYTFDPSYNYAACREPDFSLGCGGHCNKHQTYLQAQFIFILAYEPLFYYFLF